MQYVKSRDEYALRYAYRAVEGCQWRQDSDSGYEWLRAGDQAIYDGAYGEALARYDAARAFYNAAPGDADDKYDALLNSGLEDCEALANVIERAGLAQENSK